MTATFVPTAGAPDAAPTLGYRSFLTIAGDRSAVPRLVDEQIHSWLRDKGWAGDLLHTGREVRLSPEATGIRTDVLGADGTRTVRLRTTQDGGWVTQLTVHLPSHASRDAWLWMDVLAPGGQRPGPPKLIRNLVSVLDTRDGDFGMPAGPVTVDESGVDELVARLTDPGRRTIAFVAGSGGNVPFNAWAGYVRKIVERNYGLASVHILTPAATAALRERMGASHAVVPFTVRTFLPRVDVSEPDDGIRHRFLTMQRIIDANPGVLANVLKGRAIAYSLALPLPKETIRVDRSLRGRDTEVLLNELRIPAARAAVMAPAPDVQASPRDEMPVSEPSTRTPELVPQGVSDMVEKAPAVEERSLPIVVESVRAGSSEMLMLLEDAVRNLLGQGRLDLNSARQLVELSALGQRAEQNLTSIERRMSELEDQLVSAEVGILERDELLREASLDQSIAEIEVLRSENLVRRLRQRIAASALAADAWTDQPFRDDELGPQDFTDLLDRIKQLDRVEFTGNADIARKLDEHGVESWAPKAWAALLAIQDYALCRLDGRCNSDLESYLKDTPPGCATFSVNAFARDESGDVKQNSKFRQPRMLPVPETVDGSGFAFMGAHFKIARWGMVSPRLHLHDGVQDSGLVYVGYIGPHLPTKKTT